MTLEAVLAELGATRDEMVLATTREGEVLSLVLCDGRSWPAGLGDCGITQHPAPSSDPQ